MGERERERGERGERERERSGVGSTGNVVRAFAVELTNERDEAMRVVEKEATSERMRTGKGGAGDEWEARRRDARAANHRRAMAGTTRLAVYVSTGASVCPSIFMSVCPVAFDRRERTGWGGVGLDRFGTAVPNRGDARSSCGLSLGVEGGWGRRDGATWVTRSSDGLVESFYDVGQQGHFERTGSTTDSQDGLSFFLEMPLLHYKCTVVGSICLPVDLLS